MIQIQIWDPWDPRTKDKPAPANPEEWVAAYRNGRNLGSGGLWNNRRTSNRPLVLADKKPGEWNRFFIRMVGDKVSIWLNGKHIVDRTELENFWDREGNRTAPLPRADPQFRLIDSSRVRFSSFRFRFMTRGGVGQL